MRIFTILFLTCLGVCSSDQVVDYRENLRVSACIPRNCTASGPLCETCSNLVGCIDEGDGKWVKTHLATCSSPQYCVHGACTSDFDPFCSGVSDLPFTCQRVGIFPDPFYRTRFVLCINDGKELKAYLNECEPGYAFNIADDLCSIPATGESCPKADYPVPLCTTAGQTGAIPSKPAMYYLCEERVYETSKKALYPYLYVCEGGKPYVNYECGGTTTLPPTPPPTTTPTSPTAPSVI